MTRAYIRLTDEFGRTIRNIFRKIVVLDTKPPSNPPQGALYFEPTTGEIKVYNGGQWLKQTFWTASGWVTFTGNGSTKDFTADVEHGLESDKVVLSVSSTKPTSSNVSDMYAYLVDTDNDGFYETVRIVVRFDTAPADGENVNVYWKAEVVGSATE